MRRRRSARRSGLVFNTSRGVCFKCRKSYSGVVDPGLVDITAHCPDCRKYLTFISRSTRIPKKRDKKAWKKLRFRYLKK